MFGFRSRNRVVRAKAAFEAARAEHQMAERSQDTRRMSIAAANLRAANTELMAAEAAALPKPAHLPTPHGA